MRGGEASEARREEDSLTKRSGGRRGRKEECESLCSGSGSTSFLAPQWEAMKY